MHDVLMNSGWFGGPKPSVFDRAGGLYGGAGGILLAKCAPDPGAGRRSPPTGKFRRIFRRRPSFPSQTHEKCARIFFMRLP